MNQESNQKQSMSGKEILQLIVLLAVAYVIIIGAIVLVTTFSPLPTVAEATQEIIYDHPECQGQLEIVEEEIINVWSGPASVTASTYTYLVCEIADVKVQVQPPK